MANIYVLDTFSKYDNERTIVVSEDPDFKEVMGEGVEYKYNVPKDYDLNMIARMIVGNPLLDGKTSFTMHYFKETDKVEVVENVPVPREFEVRPVYIDECTLDGQTVTDTDQVQYLVTEPNGNQHIMSYKNIESMDELGQNLLADNMIENNCLVNMYNMEPDQSYDEPIQCTVNNGEFIVPAVIVQKEQVQEEQKTGLFGLGVDLNGSFNIGNFSINAGIRL